MSQKPLITFDQNRIYEQISVLQIRVFFRFVTELCFIFFKDLKINDCHYSMRRGGGQQKE